MKKKKAINNHKDFLKELKKGNKRVGVTEEFYNWLKTNIKETTTNSNYPPIAPFYGVEIYIEKDEVKDSDVK